MMPKSARKTQSSPIRANVRFHIPDKQSVMTEIHWDFDPRSFQKKIGKTSHSNVISKGYVALKVFRSIVSLVVNCVLQFKVTPVLNILLSAKDYCETEMHFVRSVYAKELNC